MIPSNKHPNMEKFLEDVFGRTTAITSNKCIPPPVGCGKPIGGFKDDISRHEYEISGLCQDCQDTVFTTPVGD
jgi:hypothetical protein